MSLVARLVALLIAFIVLPASAREIHILVIGDGAAANCNAHQFVAVPGVFQVGLDGNEKEARDPLDWSGCNGGSIWIPLGNELIRLGRASKVVFMAIAMPNMRVKDVQSGGADYPLLTRALRVIQERHMHFDYAFWQQGFADKTVETSVYRNDLNAVMKLLSRTIKIDRWLIAPGADCTNGSKSQVSFAQESLGRFYLINRYSGPKANAQDAILQTTGCNFNQAGQLNMAQAWLEAIAHTDAVSARYQRESLLYYFK